MPARQVRVPPRALVKQRRIFRQRAVCRVAPADPQLVLLFLLPPHGRRAAVYLEPEIVLVTGAHLADGHRALVCHPRSARARSRGPRSARGTLRPVRRLGLPAGALAKLGKGFPVLRRFEARGHHCVEIREHRFDGAPDDVLDQIAPVRSDIANRRALAALLGLEAPGKIRGLQQPVLQIGPMDEVGLANFAVMNHLARLLDERVAAVIEGHGVHDAGVARRVGQRPRIFCVQRKRLVRDDVLSMAQRRHDHRHVQVVGRRVVDDVHVRISGEGFVAGVCPGHSERVGLRAC